MKVRIEYKRRKELMAELERVGPNVTAALATAQLKVAQDLARRIRPYAPAETGTYRDSIIGAKLSDYPQHELHGIERSKDPNATGLFASKMLWRWIEFGTVKMKARPHIFPVYRGRKRLMMRTLRRAVNDAIRSRGAGGAGGGAV